MPTSTSTGLYGEIYEPRSKFHFEALEQTCRLRPLSGSGDKYLFLSGVNQGDSISLSQRFGEVSSPLAVDHVIGQKMRMQLPTMKLHLLLLATSAECARADATLPPEQLLLLASLQSYVVCVSRRSSAA